jgi:prepilin-type N-terminal cleavage/methylation domain-containing protein
MCRFKNNLKSGKKHRAFTIVELVAVLVIISVITTGIIEVMNRCIDSTMEYNLRKAAFETARENMENLLNAASLAESVEFGVSEVYPEIEWQTIVEIFDEPINSSMWLRARSAAYYLDNEGQQQTIEFTQWITALSKRDQELVIEQRQREDEFMEMYGLEDDWEDDYMDEEY